MLFLSGKFGMRLGVGLCLLWSLWCASSPALASGNSASRLVRAARAQIGITVSYDASYRAMAFPGGDVPLSTGVCSDVVIRAYRELGVDLQAAVHRDMKRAWRVYPKTWGLKQPDPNIDHRRVPNLVTFFRRHGRELPVSTDVRAYLAGDLVTWTLPGNLPHIGIVSSRRNHDRPLVIHNVGRGTREEDVLFAYPLTGHYRYLPR